MKSNIFEITREIQTFCSTLEFGKGTEARESGSEFYQLTTYAGYFIVMSLVISLENLSIISCVLAWCYSCTVEHLEVEKPLEITEVYESFSHISAEVHLSVVFSLIK